MTPRPLPLLFAALLLGTGMAHAGQADHVTASAAWIRVLPGNLPAGGYVTLHNDADAPAVLEGASSPVYANVMLHQSSVATGMSRMRMVDRLPVPAHGQVMLAPGGYHLMLMQPARAVTPEDRVPVVLQFADGSRLPVDFTARPASALGPD